MKDMTPMNTFFQRIWLSISVLLSVPASAVAFSNGADNFALAVMDSAGKPVLNRPVELLVELTTGTMDGEAQYAEVHVDTTDAAGWVAFAIGFGNPTDPKFVFDNYDIARGKNFIRIALKEPGGVRMLLKSQLANVPEVRKWLFASEKSNTVIAVMITVWLGIVVYLLLSGRKMRRLEQQVAELKQRHSQSS